jgi:hypothetical protein
MSSSNAVKVTRTFSGTIPGRAFLSIASAWSGMSGRVNASCAGERSSVLVSPVTLKTVTVIFFGTSGAFRNHSAAAHDSITFLACLLPAFALSATSCLASNMSSVFDRAVTAAGASASLSRAAMSPAILYPPTICPSSSTAFTELTTGDLALPAATSVRNAALTYAASSTPGGTRLEIRSSR